MITTLKKIVKYFVLIISYLAGKVIKYIVYGTVIAGVLFAMFSLGASILDINVSDAVEMIMTFKEEHGDVLKEYAEGAIKDATPIAEDKVGGILGAIAESGIIESILRVISRIMYVGAAGVLLVVLFKLSCMMIVRHRSIYTEALNELNAEYKSMFIEVKANTSYRHKCTSHRDFVECSDRTFVRTLILVEIKKDLMRWRAVNRDVMCNAVTYSEYRTIFTSVVEDMGSEHTKKRLFFSKRLYDRYERKLLSRLLLKPMTSCDFVYTVEYVPAISSKKYVEEYVFSLEELLTEFIKVRHLSVPKKIESVPTSIGFPVLEQDNTASLPSPQVGGMDALNGIKKSEKEHTVAVSDSNVAVEA